jgi:hypothetical protein
LPVSFRVLPRQPKPASLPSPRVPQCTRLSVCLACLLLPVDFVVFQLPPSLCSVCPPLGPRSSPPNHPIRPSPRLPTTTTSTRRFPFRFIHLPPPPSPRPFASVRPTSTSSFIHSTPFPSKRTSKKLHRFRLLISDGKKQPHPSSCSASASPQIPSCSFQSWTRGFRPDFSLPVGGFACFPFLLQERERTKKKKIAIFPHFAFPVQQNLPFLTLTTLLLVDSVDCLIHSFMSVPDASASASFPSSFADHQPPLTDP